MAGGAVVYSNPREGEIFPRKRLATIVGFFGHARGFSRETNEAETNQTPGRLKPPEASVHEQTALKEGTTRYARSSRPRPRGPISRNAEVALSSIGSARTWGNGRKRRMRAMTGRRGGGGKAGSM